MRRLVGETVVSREQHEVYDFLMDYGTRPLFFPEEATGFQLTSTNTCGVGASQRFEISLGKTLEGETTISGVLPPEGVTEVGRFGPVRITLRYSLEEQGDRGTRIRVALEYSISGIVNALMGPVVYAPAVTRWHSQIVNRLKSAVESRSGEEVISRAAARSSAYAARSARQTTR